MSSSTKKFEYLLPYELKKNILGIKIGNGYAINFFGFYLGIKFDIKIQINSLTETEKTKHKTSIFSISVESINTKHSEKLVSHLLNYIQNNEFALAPRFIFDYLCVQIEKQKLSSDLYNFNLHNFNFFFENTLRSFNRSDYLKVKESKPIHLKNKIKFRLLIVLDYILNYFITNALETLNFIATANNIIIDVIFSEHSKVNLAEQKVIYKDLNFIEMSRHNYDLVFFIGISEFTLKVREFLGGACKKFIYFETSVGFDINLLLKHKIISNYQFDNKNGKHILYLCKTVQFTDRYLQYLNLTDNYEVNLLPLQSNSLTYINCLKNDQNQFLYDILIPGFHNRDYQILLNNWHFFKDKKILICANFPILNVNQESNVNVSNNYKIIGYLGKKSNVNIVPYLRTDFYVSLINKSAVIFIPFDEDSAIDKFYVTVSDSLMSKKVVFTTSLKVCSFYKNYPIHLVDDNITLINEYLINDELRKKKEIENYEYAINEMDFPKTILNILDSQINNLE